MSLPTLERSYDFETNWLYTETGDGNLDRRYCSLKVYNTLLGYAHNPWTLVASSNGSTAGWPGPGWSGIGDVIYGTPRSWFVMENVHGVQILWSLTSGNDVGTWISPDGSLSLHSRIFGGTPVPAFGFFFRIGDSKAQLLARTRWDFRLLYVYANRQRHQHVESSPCSKGL